MNEEKPAETIKQPLRDNTLVSCLLPEEYDVFIWLLQAYSVTWIAETLGLKKNKVKSLALKIYKTLDVKNQSELIRYYITLKKYEIKPPRNLEDFSYAMASYTDSCAKRAIISKK